MSNQAVPFVGGLIFFGILAGGFCAQVFGLSPIILAYNLHALPWITLLVPSSH